MIVIWLICLGGKMIKDFSENCEETAEELVTNAKMYIDHICNGSGDTLVMAGKIRHDIESKKFNWSDIGITPEELGEYVKKFAETVREKNIDRMEKFNDDIAKILQFLNNITGI
jgi:hypothetical protein